MLVNELSPYGDDIWADGGGDQGDGGKVEGIYYLI
jgi:hypothetical protein